MHPIARRDALRLHSRPVSEPHSADFVTRPNPHPRLHPQTNLCLALSPVQSWLSRLPDPTITRGSSGFVPAVHRFIEEPGDGRWEGEGRFRSQTAMRCSVRCTCSSWHRLYDDGATAACKRFCFHYRHAALTIKQKHPTLCKSPVSISCTPRALNSRGYFGSSVCIRCLHQGRPGGVQWRMRGERLPKVSTYVPPQHSADDHLTRSLATDMVPVSQNPGSPSSQSWNPRKSAAFAFRFLRFTGSSFAGSPVAPLTTGEDEAK